MKPDEMSFTMHGTWRGREVTVRWGDGQVAAPSALREEILLRDRLRRGMPGGLPGYESGLSHPLGAVMLIRDVLDSVDEFDGMKVAPVKRSRRLRAEERAVLLTSRRAIPA